MGKLYFYLTAGRHIARLDETKPEYRNAEILYDGQWQKAFPADLLWNMQPINKARALHLLIKWNPQPITGVKAVELMNGVTA